MAEKQTRLRLDGGGVAVLLLLSSAALAQGEKGIIAGTVTDASGAVVVGAAVTVTGAGTNAVRTATTDGTGSYTITNLSPGSLHPQGFAIGVRRISAEFPGIAWRALRPGRQAARGRRVNYGRGCWSGFATQVDTESSAITQVVDTKRVAQLPSLTRDPYDFVQTLGNVAQDSSSGTGGKDQITRGAGVSINGQRSSGVDILLDGGENVDLFTTRVGQSVPLDAVQEFSVTSSNFTAEYGRASGGVINVVTKSGTNAFHGSVYDFNRVSALTSNDYDSNANGIPKQRYTRNQFGYSVGGPIIKDKLFFFSSTEWQRVRSAATAIAVVMDPAFLAAASPATQAFFNQPFRSGLTTLQQVERRRRRSELLGCRIRRHQPHAGRLRE